MRGGVQLSRGKRASLLVAVPALGIFAIAFAGPAWERIQEELHLRNVAKSTGPARARSLAWLVEHGSVRGVAIALEEVLDWNLSELPREGTLFSLLANRRLQESGARELKFTGFDEVTLSFLAHPWIKPAALSEFELPWTGYEDELERVLREGSTPLRAQALGVLFKVGAPSSVGAQWSAIQELRRSCPALEKPLARMAAAFDPQKILKYLSDERRPEAWAIRAAGVLQLREALPRLGEISLPRFGDLSKHPDREGVLAALGSIADFDGPETEAQLERCLLEGSYDLYIRAGAALFRKNRDRFQRILLGEAVPEHARWWQGLMLGRLDRPEAVPLLASEVAELHTMDAEMFQHLERLAGPQHREILLELPEKVRPDQRPRAEQVVRGYLARHPGR